jgi:hypothetical protein
LISGSAQNARNNLTIRSYLLTVLLLANEAVAQRTERSRKTAVVYVHAHMHVLVSVFEQLHLNLISLAIEFDFIGAYLEKCGYELIRGLATPLPDLDL